MGRRHAENLARRVTGAALVAACSPTADELSWAQRELGVAQAFADYAAMLAQSQVIDAVFLVDADDRCMRSRSSRRCHAGKHVFSEKPLVARSRRMPPRRSRRGEFPRTKVMIGFVRRFDPPVTRDAHGEGRAVA